jgi:hypothetical protein
MTEYSNYNKLDTCPSPSICQLTNNKCKNFSLVDLNNSLAFNVTESFVNISSNSNNSNEELLVGIQNTLENIKIIQTMEGEIYNKLLQNDTTKQLSSQDVQKLLTELTNLSTIKLNLYDSIKDIYDSSINSMTSSQQTVQEQLVAIKIVEKELQNSANRMRELDDNNINKMRMIEINRYSEEKYNDHAGFIKWLILFIVVLLIIYILNKRLFINDSIYNILLFITILIGFIILGKYYYKMIFRSNMDYQEYKFPYADVIGSTSKNSSFVNPWENPSPLIQNCLNDNNNKINDTN